MRFNLKRNLLRIFAVLLVVFFIIATKFFAESGLFISLLIAALVVYTILAIVWWRCPHCGRYLGRIPPFSSHCPHCGNELDD